MTCLKICLSKRGAVPHVGHLPIGQSSWSIRLLTPVKQPQTLQRKPGVMLAGRTRLKSFSLSFGRRGLESRAGEAGHGLGGRHGHAEQAGATRRPWRSRTARSAARHHAGDDRPAQVGLGRFLHAQPDRQRG